MNQKRKPTQNRKPRSHEGRRRAAFLSERLRPSPRVADVFRDLMADKPDAGAYLESQALKVAELTIRAEELRARLETMTAADMPGDKDPVRSLATLINAVTRLEGTTRRAAADLVKAAPAKSTPWISPVQAYVDAKYGRKNANA